MNKDKNEWKKQYIQSKCQVIKMTKTTDKLKMMSDKMTKR